MNQEVKQPIVKSKKKISINYKITSIVLLAIVFVLLVILWHPWNKPINANTRTVAVTGTATVQSTPNEFVFYPMYNSTNTDSQAAIAELSKKSEEIVAKLKELGVSDENIKTNASSNDGRYMMTEMYPVPDTTQSTLQITITTNSREDAQKVQDYLLTTGAEGSVSPVATFSSTKQKDLESQARDEAAKDAKSKAEQMAQNLGFKLGPVKSVDEQPSFSGIMPMASTAQDMRTDTIITGSGGSAVSALPATGTISVSGEKGKTAMFNVMPGQDQITYSVNVTYYVK